MAEILYRKKKEIGQALATKCTDGELMDFPRAWAISKLKPMERHDPKCSYRVSVGALLCDCYVLTKHPEYLEDYGTLNDISHRQEASVDKIILTAQDRINQIHSVLGKVVDALTQINRGSYPGDVDEILNEVRDDLSNMQEID